MRAWAMAPRGFRVLVYEEGGGMAKDKADKTKGKAEGTMMFRNWWAVALRGLVMVVFGILALAWPDKTVTVLLRIFGIIILVYGFVMLIEALLARRGEEQSSIWPLAGALVAIVAGVLTLAWSSATSLVVLYIIAIWAIVSGVIEVIAAFSFPVRDWAVWLLASGGLVSIIVGIWLISFPGNGILGLAWLIGLYALFIGLVHVVVGFRMRSFKVAG